MKTLMPLEFCAPLRNLLEVPSLEVEKTTPGTVSAALSDDRRHLLVHVLNLDDADDVIRQIKTRYEAPLMEIFP